MKAHEVIGWMCVAVVVAYGLQLLAAITGG